MSARILIIACCLVSLAAPAATFTVINTNDAGAGSLRQAILENNATPGGLHLIQFHIPGAGVQTIRPLSVLPDVTRPVVIDGFTQPGASANTLTIGNNAALKIRLDGSALSNIISGIRLNAGGSVVRGLVLVNFHIGNGGQDSAVVLKSEFGSAIEGCFVGLEADGSTVSSNGSGVLVIGSGSRIGGNTAGARNVISGNFDPVLLYNARSNIVQGNYIGTDASGMFARGNRGGLAVVFSQFNVIGGTNALERNVISGNGTGGLELLYQANSNRLQGNYVGVNAIGTAALPNSYGALSLSDSHANVVGGSAAGAGNVFSGNHAGGVWITQGSARNVFQGNRIGTSADGMSAISNSYSGSGIQISLGFNTLIGGPGPGEGNQISGNRGAGIEIDCCGATNNRVQGNLIGTDATGLGPLGNGLANNGPGLEIGSSGNTIGGTNDGEGNVIAFNSGAGVRMYVEQGDPRANPVQRNSIHSNGSIGIDLHAFGGFIGVTPNDAGDADTGPNDLQNFPALTFAAFTATEVILSGTLNSRSNQTYRLDFYHNPVCDSSGFGEGKTWIAATNVTTDASGNATFTIRLGGSFAGYITSTATDPIGNTSEFSQCALLIPFRPDVAISMRDSADPVAVGGMLSYIIQITNRGPADATGVVLTNFLPASVNFVLATASQGSCVQVGGIVTCDVGGLFANSSAVVTIDVMTTVEGSVENQAVASVNEIDGNLSNNSATEITVVGIKPELAVSIHDTADPVSVGAEFSYIVEIINNGPGDATGVVVTNILSSTIDFVSVTSSQGSCAVTGGVVTCDLGSLATLGLATVSITVTGSAPAQGFMSARVIANETENNTSNNSDSESTYIGSTDIVLRRELSTNYIVAGQPFSISLTASNAGPSSATDVYIYYSLDSSLVLVGVELSQGSYQSVTYANFGTIPVGGIATLTLHVIPTDAGVAYEHGYAYGREHDPNTGNNNLYGSIWIEEGAGVFEFSQPRFTVFETGGTAAITVTRLGGALGTASVSYATADVTATAGSDYTAASGTLVFTDGETSKTFTVPVHEDAISECNESVRLTLFSPAGGAVLVRNTNATLLIFESNASFVGALEAISLDTNVPPRVGDSYSYSAATSADGSSVAFFSYSRTLVTNDYNDFGDVFLRDVTNRTTQLISVNTNGVSADGHSEGGPLSADGRFVAFASYASDLVPIATQGERNIFLRDVVAGTTALVSVNTNGTSGSDDSLHDHRMTPDGRFVVFWGEARNLVTNEINGYRYNVFLRDMSNGIVELISVSTNGNSANSDSHSPSISDDGRYVVFTSAATDLNAAVLSHGPGGSDDYGKDDIFVRDRVSATNILCSVSTNGTGGNSWSDYSAAISANGRVVVFTSYASDLVPGDTNGTEDVFAYDIANGIVHLVSVNLAASGSGDRRSFGAKVSADGRYVVFESLANNLAPGGGQFGDVFVRDLVAGTTALVSANCYGTGGGNANSRAATISADGRFVTFESYASDLAPGDFAVSRVNIFRRDLLTDTTLLVSFNHELTGAGNRWSSDPAISANGSSIVFVSDASNLVANDGNGASDIFLWQASAGGSAGANPSIASLRLMGGQPTLSVHGTSGTLYSLERTMSLMPPVSWTLIGTTNAPAGGWFEFIDSAPLPAPAFYRVGRP